MERYFKTYSKKQLINELKNNKKLLKFYLKYLNDYVFKLSKTPKKATLETAIDHIKYDKKDYSGHKTVILKIASSYIAIANLINLTGELAKPLKLKQKALYLYSSYVIPKYRGRGINSLITKYIHKTSKHNIYIIIDDKNTSSVKSYTKYGFKKTNIKSHYGNTHFYYVLKV